MSNTNFFSFSAKKIDEISVAHYRRFFQMAIIIVPFVVHTRRQLYYGVRISTAEFAGHFGSQVNLTTEEDGLPRSITTSGWVSQTTSFFASRETTVQGFPALEAYAVPQFRLHWESLLLVPVTPKCVLARGADVFVSLFASQYIAIGRTSVRV